MRSNLPFIRARLAPNLAQSGTDITLQWTVHTGGTTDPVTGKRTGGTSETRTQRIKGFVHFAEAKTVERRFAEIEVGDAIVDVAPDAPIDGKTALRFLIEGQAYVQKETPSKLAQMWDVVAQGRRLHRTVLLRKAT